MTTDTQLLGPIAYTAELPPATATVYGPVLKRVYADSRHTRAEWDAIVLSLTQPGSPVPDPSPPPAPALSVATDQPLSIYAGEGAPFPKGAHLWAGEQVAVPFDLLAPDLTQFAVLGNAPNAGETLKLTLYAASSGYGNPVLAEYSYVAGAFALTGGTVQVHGYPLRVPVGARFELRSDYAALAPNPAFPNRTYASGVSASFVRRFYPG